MTTTPPDDEPQAAGVPITREAINAAWPLPVPRTASADFDLPAPNDNIDTDAARALPEPAGVDDILNLVIEYGRERFKAGEDGASWEFGRRREGDEHEAEATSVFNQIKATLSARGERAAEPVAPDCNGLDTPERVRFYEHDFYVLSNFSAFNLEWQGITFPTSEHAYHWEKFATAEMGLPGGRSDIAYMVMTAPSAHEAFKVAERNKDKRRPDWDAVKVGIMLNILRAKAHQHEYVRRKLLATGDRDLVEDSWRDDYWGWGPNRDGQNMLGKLWMQVRAELRALDTTETAAPAAPKGTFACPRCGLDSPHWHDPRDPERVLQHGLEGNLEEYAPRVGHTVWTREMLDAIQRGVASPLCGHPNCPDQDGDSCNYDGTNGWPSKPSAAPAAGEPTLDPNEGDPYTLWAEIIRLRAALEGPPGYATWQDAAVAERVRRVRAEAALPTQEPTEQVSDEDMVLVPRGLLGAACSAIDKKRDAPNVLAKLRAITMARASQPAGPDTPSASDLRAWADNPTSGSQYVPVHANTLRDLANQLDARASLPASGGKREEPC